jgi:hypothetical protein
MTIRNFTLSDADIAALVAVRSIIADAHQHPGRTAALEVIDRFAEQAELPPGHQGAPTEAAARPGHGKIAQPRLVAVPRVPRRPVTASENTSCNRTAVLLGRWHIGGACCQDTRCAACGAAEHHQQRVDAGQVVDHDQACERCDAHRFDGP